jgi:RNA polymerase sigma factor (sigma-70 family)
MGEMCSDRDASGPDAEAAPAEFLALLQGIREGSPDAVRGFLGQYGPLVLRVVRRRLDRRLRTQYDSTDFTQDIWASFFAHQLGRPFERPDDVVAFLVQLAQNKLNDRARERLFTQRRDVSREQSLDDDLEKAGEELPGRQPTPSQFAVANDTWQRLLSDLTPRERNILDLLRLGYSQRDTAVRAGVTVRTVRRLVEKLTGVNAL